MVKVGLEGEVGSHTFKHYGNNIIGHEKLMEFWF